MALTRRATGRFANSIWPGFVDAMTALILVLFFVLSIFMIVQFVLRDRISGQDIEIETQDQQLDELSLQVANLADALGLERSRADTQETLVATLTERQSAAESRIAALTAERDAAAAEIAGLNEEAADSAARISAFEAQVANLIAQNADISADLDAAQTESEERLSRAEALDLALAQARNEIDESTEAARLAAAQREALEALTQSLREDIAGLEADALSQTQAISDAEAARLTEAAAAQALRDRLAESETELTAMTLNLESERRRAEETLTLLAAAEAARKILEESEAAALSEDELQAAQLAQAEALLAEQTELSAEAQRQVALLNQQTAELRSQLDGLQGLLDESQARDIEAKVQIESLGRNLNTALARVAAEEAARAQAESERAELEARERARLEEEAKDLRQYRSEFFARMSEVLGEREGVQVDGDRFVFPSEVLFAPGSATLGAAGREQVARVAEVIREIADDVPEEIDWVLRVDGHTDRRPVSASSAFADNWELSQARALSVVRFMTESLGLPAERLAATGFGEFRPVDLADTPEALARNRRIELKFTER